MQPPKHSETSQKTTRKVIAPFEIISNELANVQKLIDQTFKNSGKSIKQLLKGFNQHTGKMIRPGLVLLAGKTCANLTNDHINIAAITEIIHNATLLHDDVIDEGKMRRGQPTINELEGNEPAVLLGDFLLSRAFKMCVTLKPNIIQVITDIAGRTCEGELRQVSNRRNWQLTEPEYIDIITEKSAAFFSNCCYLGAALSNTDENTLKKLTDFGLNLGIAFQITDDLLDLQANEKQTGKTAGNDIDKNKPTLPIIHLLKTADPVQKKSTIEKLNNTTDNTDSFMQLLRQNNSLDYAKTKAAEFAKKATEAVADLPPGKPKQALIDMVEFVLKRRV